MILRPGSKLATRQDLLDSRPMNAPTIGGLPPEDWVGRRVRVRFSSKAGGTYGGGVLIGAGPTVGTVRMDNGTVVTLPIRSFRADYSAGPIKV